ncbi:MAG: redoxin domain-containing protein [Planctomycetes bacterium]|nr:redoxin domain-containing protein [Planctomycetota bacterium]
MRQVICGGLSIVGCCLWATLVSAQAPAAGGAAAAADTTSVIGNRAPEFPQAPSAWVNSMPLSLEAVAGKGIVMYFFHAADQGNQKAWPKVLDTAKESEGKPVLFIGIVPGVPAQVVQSYAQQFSIPWPMIADQDRALEAAYGVGTIAADNATQVMYIKADGTVGRGDYRDLARTATSAGAGAKWKLDPATVPEGLKPAWFAIEFGDPSKAALVIKKALTSRKQEEKSSAENLKAIVQNTIEKLAEEAKKASDDGKKWDAYVIYNKLTEDYKGFDLPPEVPTQKKELAASAEIKAAIAARKQIDLAKKQIALGKPANKKQAATALTKVVNDMAGNALGKEAQALLDTLGSP